MAVERLRNVSSQGQISKFREDQVAQASNWDGIPDEKDSMLAAAHIIHVVPKNGSTCTYVNALDNHGDDSWVNPPGGFGEQGGIHAR